MPQFSTKRRVRHTAAEMFELVADVERYPEFVPLCRALKVRERQSEPDGTEVLVADMTAAYKLISERLTSNAPEAVSQKLMAFNTGNATSRTPSCSGIAKFISPITNGMATKKIMMVPWAEKI